MWWTFSFSNRLFPTIDFSNLRLDSRVDCKLHQQLAHQAIVEWALAMSSLALPPYVLEHIFDSLKLHSKHQDYQQRLAIDFLWLPNKAAEKINLNFVHLIIEERGHSENIQLFIAVRNAFQQRIKS